MKTFYALLIGLMLCTGAQAQYTPPPASPPFSVAQGGTLATTPNSSARIIFDGNTGSPALANVNGHNIFGIGGNSQVIIFNDNGDELLIGDGNGELQINKASGQIVWNLDGSGNPVITSANNETLLSVSGGHAQLGPGQIGYDSNFHAQMVYGGSIYGWDSSGHMQIDSGGQLHIINLATSDPSDPNNIWNNQGVLMYSGSTAPWLAPNGNGSALTGITASQVNAASEPSATAYLSGSSVAIASIAATTAPADTTYSITGNLTVTAVATDVIQLQVTYTDETNASRTVIFSTIGATPAISISATGAYTFASFTIRAKSGTAVTIKTVLTVGAGSITYNVGAAIQPLY